MRYLFILIIYVSSSSLFAQTIPVTETEYTVQKNGSKEFSFSLRKGYLLKATVMQKGIDVEVFVQKKNDTARLFYIDSPNGTEGPEPVNFESKTTGDYVLVVKPFAENTSAEGKFSLKQDAVLSPADVKKIADARVKDETDFLTWLSTNSTAVKYVDAGNDKTDLLPLKNILQNVQVVGLGESSHGTSEFFRMKHRLLEFLVEEMDYRSFYIEASMSRCRYINDYVLYGKGDLDTATVIQGFVTWRVVEFRNMIAWMRAYNSKVPDDKKVKFFGYDLQVNDMAWKELKTFYQQIKPSAVPRIDSLMANMNKATRYVNNFADSLKQKGQKIFTSLHKDLLLLLEEIVMNAGQYRSLITSDLYHRNWENIRLLIQETESFKDGYTDRRDYYMAENILHLLQQEKPGTKVVVWAHNGHIAKISTPVYSTMGHWLDSALKQKYYALGFEFYSGSFQTRNMDINTWSSDWDIMSVTEPSKGSLPWYLNKTGKENLLLDFRNTGIEKVKLAGENMDMHSFGSMYSTQWPSLSAVSLSYVDGILYIRKSTAAKNFKKFYL